MSTIVPMAMAMPDSETMLASTPNSFIAMNEISTASGITALISSDSPSCDAMIMTTIVVMRICSYSALLSVPSVS